MPLCPNNRFGSPFGKSTDELLSSCSLESFVRQPHCFCVTRTVLAHGTTKFAGERLGEPHLKAASSANSCVRQLVAAWTADLRTARNYRLRIAKQCTKNYRNMCSRFFRKMLINIKQNGESSSGFFNELGQGM